LACTRGVNDPTDLEYFLSEEINLNHQDELNDIQFAADCINESIDMGIKIAVFGDYDCDGVSATAIMYKYLVSRNADVIAYIPDRLTEGYGMSINAVDSLKAQGIELIITVDNGIACKEEIDYANSIGMSTIVTDHHLPPEELPDAVAVIDPHRTDSMCSFKDICGAFVAFKVICATEGKEPEEMILDYADLIAIATIGDVMPLVNENRSVVRLGTKLIKKNKNIGLSAILSVSGVDRNTLDSQKIAYSIVPRLNAAGRMGDAERAFRLLISDNMVFAIALANEIDNENVNRKNVEKDIFSRVVKTIEDNGYKHNKIIVVSGYNFHPGVLGIVAAKVCEKYGKPAFVLNCEDDVSYGSARSIKGFNLYDSLCETTDLLIKFGGHELAAGITISTKNIDDFRIKINEYAESLPRIIPELNIDFCINPKVMSIDMVDAIRDLEPFGNSNPVPLFGILNTKVEQISSLSDGKHIKLTLSRDDTVFKALMFNTARNTFPIEVGDVVDIAVMLDINNYRGESYLSVIIKAIRPSGINEDRVFDDVFAIDNYILNGVVNPSFNEVDRESIGLIYKFIAKGETTFQKTVFAFIKKYGYANIYLSIKILFELNLVSEKDGILFTTDIRKTELTNSNVYNEIKDAVIAFDNL